MLTSRSSRSLLGPLLALAFVPVLPACGGASGSPDLGASPDAATDLGQDGGPADLGVDQDQPTDLGTDLGPDAGPTDPGVIDVEVLGAADLDFGEWACGDAAPAARTIQIENTGPSPAVFGVRRFELYREWFSYVGPAGGQLAPGATTTFTVRPELPPNEDLAPISASEILATINVDALQGAIGGLTVSPRVTRAGARFYASGDFDLGDVAVGTPGGATFGVVNLRAEPVTLNVTRHLDPEVTVTIPGEASGQITLAAFETRSGTFAYMAAGVGVARGSVRFDVDGADCWPASPREATFVARAVTGALRVSTRELDLGTAGCGELLGAQTVTITNGGAGVMNWSATLAAGAESPYEITPTGGSLSAGASQPVTITPSRAPDVLATLPLPLGDVLRVTSDVPTDEDVSVVLRHRVSGPVFVWDDAREVRLLANVGERATTAFTLRNVGSAAGTASVVASGSSVVTRASDSPVVIGAGESSPVTVAFEPTEGAPSGTSGVYVTSASACSLPPSETAPRVEGRPRVAGLETPLESVYLGTARCDQLLAPTPFAVTNTLDVGLDVALTIGGDIEITLGGVPVGESVTFAPGQTRTFSARATDVTSYGEVRGAFTLTPLGRLPLTVNFLSVRNGAEVSAAGAVMGTVHVGQEVQQVVQLQNDGNVTALVAVEHLGVNLAGTVEVPPGPSSIRFVRVIPAGAFNDVVRFTAASDFVCNAPIEDAVFTGNGMVQATSVSATSLDFGSVYCQGDPPGSRVVTVRNNSAAPVNFSAQVLGTPAGFLVDPPTGTIPANGSRDISVIPLRITQASPGYLHNLLRITTDSARHDLPLRAWILGFVLTAPASVTLPTTPVGESSAATSLGIRSTGTTGHPRDLRLVSVPSDELRFGFDRAALNEFAVFTPTSSGSRSFTVSIEPHEGDPICAPPPAPIDVTAMGISTAVALVSPTALTFPTARCGEAAPPMGFTVENVGPAAFTYTTTSTPNPRTSAVPSTANVASGARQTITLTPATIPLGTFEPELMGSVSGFFYRHTETRTVLADGTANPVTITMPIVGDGWYVMNSGVSDDGPTDHTVYVTVAVTRFPDGTPTYTFSPATMAGCTVVGSLTQLSTVYYEFLCDNDAAPGSAVLGAAARTGSAPCVRSGIAFSYP